MQKFILILLALFCGNAMAMRMPLDLLKVEDNFNPIPSKNERSLDALRIQEKQEIHYHQDFFLMMNRNIG